MSKACEDAHARNVRHGIIMKQLIAQTAKETIDTIRDNAVDMMNDCDSETLLSEGETIAHIEQFVHHMNAVHPVWFDDMMGALLRGDNR